ncbi:hypothetical protein O4H61_06165 [Roseovarius aestuarii]|nr:hypothetical protein [Roseovarius aestuarii]
MTTIGVFRLGMIACACTALGACGTSSSGGAGGPGGGGGGGGTPAQAMAAFDAAMDEGPKMGPTTINPKGKANYAGKTKINTINENQTGFSGFVIGDLEMEADFDQDTLSGTATNFKGQIDDKDVTLDGTLDTANITGNEPNMVVTSDPIEVAGQKIHTTSLLGALEGKLKNSLTDETADVQLILQGTAFGANADRFQGGAAAIIGNKDEVGFAFGGSGEFYLDRQ